MQLNIRKGKSAKDVGLALAAATCALFSTTPAGAADGDPGTWRFDTAVLYYGEDDGRVQAAEPVISATRYFNNEKSLNLKLIVDSLTGASPSGATPSADILTYTQPSGNGAYTVAAGDAPLDPSFKDTRTALSASWSASINRDWSYTAAIYGSAEHDYKSLGLSGSLSRYLNQKNTQLNLGLSLSADSVNPEGSVPVGLSRQAVPGMTDFDTTFYSSRDGDNDTKSLMDVLLGVTQIINKRTIMQFNYSFSNADGYLTDPYKILSIIDDTSGATYGSNARDNNGIALFVHEKRPDSRLKHALYWQTKYMTDGGHVLDGSYRFMTDDWGVTSHTLDFKYRWQLQNSYFEPHLRYYTQTEADFYQRYLVSSEYNLQLANTEFASADYRLGKLTGVTVGLKYGRKVFDDQEFTVRAEYFMQSSDGDKGIGALAQQDLYFDTNAMMFTIGYSF